LSRFEIYPFRCQSCGKRFFVRQVGQVYSPEGDKREYSRVKAEFSLTFKVKDMESRGRLVDLSLRGCAMESDHELKRGDVLQVTLKMPNGKQPVEIDTAVVRYSQGIRHGLEFLTIKDKSEKDLREFVEERLDRKKVPQGV
jgi:c-di-GMP-binding flagellar brake protein YcgR